MAGILVTDAGEVELLKKTLKNTTDSETYLLKLFQSNTEVTSTSVEGDFTLCDFTGYATKTLTRGNWTDPTSISGKANTTYPTQTWTCSGGSNDIYGYLVIGGTSNVLLWGETFVDPIPISSGNSYSLDLTLTGSSAN